MHDLLKDLAPMESIAQQANHEGNDSLLLFQRLSHPAIRAQLINLLLDGEKDHASRGHLEPIKDLTSKTKGSSVDVNFKHVQYQAKTYEQLEREFSGRLDAAQTSTPVETSRKMPRLNGREVIPIGFLLRGEKPSTEYMSAVEAHEKGHYLRPYFGRFFDSHFAPGFDSASITYSEEDMAWLRPKNPNVADTVIEEMTTAYLMRGGEIAERMSQLKNYFGMRGNEKFTAAHLAYAREHYVPDTGIDNGMGLFFRAITPKTQKEFLRLVNSSGI